MIFSLKELKSCINGIEGSYFDGQNLLGIEDEVEDNELSHIEEDNVFSKSSNLKHSIHQKLKTSEYIVESMKLPKRESEKYKMSISQFIKMKTENKKNKEESKNIFEGEKIHYYSQMNTINKNLINLQDSDSLFNLSSSNEPRNRNSKVFNENDSVDKVSRFKTFDLFEVDFGSSPYPRNKLEKTHKVSKFKSNGVFLEINGLKLEQVILKRMQKWIWGNTSTPTTRCSIMKITSSLQVIR
jgi:hypothetical protein